MHAPSNRVQIAVIGEELGDVCDISWAQNLGPRRTLRVSLFFLDLGPIQTYTGAFCAELCRVRQCTQKVRMWRSLGLIMA